jgi:PAS domain S-box-containing protein
MKSPESKPDRSANRVTQHVSDKNWVKRRFEDLFEAVPDAAVVVDSEGKIAFTNSLIERLFGYDRTELHGQRLDILLPERFRDRHGEHFKSFFGDPRTRPMGVGLRLFGQRKDGQEFPVDISLCPLQVKEKSFVVGCIRDVTVQKRNEQKLQQALEEIGQLKDQLQEENIYLRQQINVNHDHGEIISQSAAIGRVLSQVEQVAVTDSAVLLLGETGTGKELLARAVHRLSLRKDRAMVTVNCAALPATLVESELFGSEEGAYTGALSKRIGRFEIADHSTIFLDEIGDLPE